MLGEKEAIQCRIPEKVMVCVAHLQPSTMGSQVYDLTQHSACVASRLSCLCS